MTVYLISTIHNYICLDGDERPATAGIPIGSRIEVLDTGAVEMFIGYYFASGSVSGMDQPEEGDTIDIGCTTYTFVADDPGIMCDGEIAVGATVAAAVANIVAAINGTDGVNTPNPDVTAEATAADAVTLTAIETGTGGNAITTVYTADCCSSSMNAFGAATLEGGFDEWTALP